MVALTKKLNLMAVQRRVGRAIAQRSLGTLNPPHTIQMPYTSKPPIGAFFFVPKRLS
jgi:hypothetical protein